MLVQIKSLSEIFHKGSYEKNIFKKINTKFSIWKNTLCNINLSLYDLYVHEYTLCWI